MRVWSLHPSYLDTKGLVALWRETLLAQSVINKVSGGYSNHPQLKRFRAHTDPLGTIGFYLNEIVKEAKSRNYNFAEEKIISINSEIKIPVHSGQVKYEFDHLRNKLKERDPKKLEVLEAHKNIILHPLFYLIEGDIEDWEIIN